MEEYHHPDDFFRIVGYLEDWKYLLRKNRQRCTGRGPFRIDSGSVRRKGFQLRWAWLPLSRAISRCESLLPTRISRFLPFAGSALKLMFRAEPQLLPFFRSGLKGRATLTTTW
jgi:hypothetical protein